MSKRLIISHAGCNDGTWAAHVCLAKYPDAKVYFASYHQDPPDVTGLDVIMVDFSYKRAVLLDMKEKANSLIVLDHHLSAQEDLEGLDFCIFDQEHSGAVMAWLYLFPDRPVPDLLKRVEDYDLWRFHFEDTKRVVQGMYLYGKDDVQRELDIDALLQGVGDDRLTFYADVGSVLVKSSNHAVSRLKSKAHDLKIGGHWVKAVNTTEYVSELGAELAAKSKFAVIWSLSKDSQHIQLSFRSDRDNPDHIKVKDIATSLGGGGHEYASGAKMTLSEFLLCLNPYRNARSEAYREITPDAVLDFLKHHGWIEVASTDYKRGEVYQPLYSVWDLPKTEFQVLVPHDPERSEYTQRMAEVVTHLAQAHRRERHDMMFMLIRGYK
jgi:nanoRNase/pAp phosphatase (c-di-AMP/oligoRNAs hydrolase)